MSKKLIQSDGTEFEQNGKDMAIIDTRSRGGIPIMINADEFNEAYANADSETKAMIHAGGGGEEVDPIFTASPAAGITSDDITSWNSKSTFSGDYDDLQNKPTIPVVPTDVSAFNNDAGYLTAESEPAFTASAAYGISSQDISSWNGKADSSAIPVNVSDLINDLLYMTPPDFYDRFDLAEYNPESTYSVGDYAYVNDALYVCDTDILIPEDPFDPHHWTAVTTLEYLQDVLSSGPSASEIHFVDDSELDPGNTFHLKGQTKGLYFFNHTIGLHYDTTNQVSEAFQGGLLWLSKDVDPSDQSGGIVGGCIGLANLEYNANGYNELYTPNGPTMIITAPTMPATMSGVIVSSSSSSSKVVTPAKLYMDLGLSNYSYQSTYAIGDWVFYSDEIYVCSTAVSTPGTFNPAYWTKKSLLDYLTETIAVPIAQRLGGI